MVALSGQPGFSRALHLGRQAAVRLVGAAIVVLGVATTVFIISSLTQQNAALAVLGGNVSPEAVAQFKHDNGLDRSTIAQYGSYLWGLLHGDLGKSMVTGQSISSLVGKAIPVTATLAVLATLVAAIVSLILGCTAARFHGRWPDRGVRFFGSIFQSMPTFWIGVLAVQVIAIRFKLLPAEGYVSPSQSLSGWIRSIILPVLTLAIPFSAGLTRIVRSSMVEQLDRDYVRTARGLGLAMRTIMLRTVMRNGLIAPVTILALSLGGLLGGAVLVEVVFQLPGLGLLLENAVSTRDFGVVEGVSMVSGVAFVVVNLLIDVAQTWLNPKKANEV